MKIGRTWPWGLGLGLLAVLLVLTMGGGGGSPAIEGAAPAARSASPPIDVPRIQAAAPIPAAPSVVVPRAADRSEPPAPGLPATPEATDPWERIPLDRKFGESLGDIGTRRAFSKAMITPPVLAPCTEAWTAPPGVRQIDMKIELRVRSQDDQLVVEDASVIEANVSDAGLERCVVASLRGRRSPAPGIPPGQSFRIEWGAVKTLR